jgi:hypothetical protein
VFPTREGKLYCCAVLDAHSRRVVGWSIDSRQATSLVTSTLGMVVKNRKPTTGTVVHCDHGSQFSARSSRCFQWFLVESQKHGGTVAVAVLVFWFGIPGAAWKGSHKPESAYRAGAQKIGRPCVRAVGGSYSTDGRGRGSRDRRVVESNDFTKGTTMSKSAKITVLLGLAVALTAIAAYGATSAIAINYQRCAKVLEKETGNYTEAECLTKGAKAEWIRAFFPGNILNLSEECAQVVEEKTGMFPTSECATLTEETSWVRLLLANSVFSGTSGVSRLIAGANVIRCISDTDSGTLSGKDSLSKVVVNFKSCKLEGLEAVTCKTTGAAEGEVATASLAGRLGYVEVLGKKVGALLKPEAGEEFTKGEIVCGLLGKIKVRGSVIGEVTPINTFTTKEKMIFKVVGGKQEWTEIQIEELPQTAKLESSTNGGAFEAAQEETVEEAIFEEHFKISA